MYSDRIHRCRLGTCLSLGVLLTVPVLSHAAIIGTTGAVEQIAAPPSVMIGSLESNDTIFAFQERSLMRLGQDVLVDVTQPGVVIYIKRPDARHDSQEHRGRCVLPAL